MEGWSVGIGSVEELSFEVVASSNLIGALFLENVIRIWKERGCGDYLRVCVEL